MADKVTWDQIYSGEYEKSKKKKPKETEAQARIKRLVKQDPKWAGTTQAELDSAMVSGKLPQFETTAQKYTKTMKRVSTQGNKLKGEISKLQADVDAFKELDDAAISKLNLMYPNKLVELQSKEKQLKLKKGNLKKLEKKYPDWDKNDPLSILD